MKLRIKGDSLRLRLTRPEVQRIGEGLEVREKTHFTAAGACFEFALVPSAVDAPQAELSGSQMIVRVPREQARAWAQSATIAIKAAIPAHTGSSLFVLIEKDFACLKPRENELEDESQMFENPNAATGCCG